MTLHPSDFPPTAVAVYSLSLSFMYGFIYLLVASLVAQRVKRLPAMRETWVQSLGWEDPLQKEMATHSSTLAWKIPWTEKPGTVHRSQSQT